LPALSVKRRLHAGGEEAILDVVESLVPQKLNLKKDTALEIEWADGTRSVYPIAFLRMVCPCAMCKETRGEGGHGVQLGKKPMLTIMPGNFSQAVSAVHAELVGNYALRIDWSDNHGTGIYSFQYLRSLKPPKSSSPPGQSSDR
jgi:DUF971 family protein